MWLYSHRFGWCYGLAYIPNRFAHACTMYEHTYKRIYLCVSHREWSVLMDTHPPTALIPTWTQTDSIPQLQPIRIGLYYWNMCVHTHDVPHSNSWSWAFSLPRSWPRSPGVHLDVSHEYMIPRVLQPNFGCWYSGVFLLQTHLYYQVSSVAPPNH